MAIIDMNILEASFGFYEGCDEGAQGECWGVGDLRAGEI